MARKKTSTQTPTISKRRPNDVLNRSIIGVSLLVLIAVLFMGWRALNGSGENSLDNTVTPLVSSSPKAVDDMELRLNHTYQRQGAEIKTDPSQLGRAGNPLSAPPVIK